jgi:NAD(P)-dependent dehydrogenase (short-subunit alcohol dehydrogenase family)
LAVSTRWRWRARGAAVVVNDLGACSTAAAARRPRPTPSPRKSVRPAAGRIANGASVTDADAVQAMVARRSSVGRVDILINNAGILRDKTFAKMELADFRLVVDVHLMGAVHCTKAVWETMRTQNYGASS